MDLTQLAQTQPGKPAYIMGRSGEQLSYAELHRRSCQGAQLLRSLGLQPGDHVAFQVENSLAFVELLWSMRRAGLIYTAISTHLKRDEVAYIIDNSDAKAVVFSRAHAEVGAEVRKLLPNVEHWLVANGEAAGLASWESACAVMPATPLADECAGAPMLYSSGTTGRPKGVLPHWKPGIPLGELTPVLQILARLFSLDRDSIYLSPAPCYHSAPITYCTLMALLGGTCIIMEKFDAEASLGLIETYRVSHSQWVPIMFVRMLQLPEAVRNQYDVSSLSHAIHAAAPCPQDVKRRMIDWFGPVIYEYYSSTEGGGMTSLDSTEWLAHPGSVGRATVGRLHILDDEGNELPPGEVGTIYYSEVRSRFEYYKDEAKTQEAHTRDGWMTVGDVGYLDADGYLYLADRKDFMIISGGVNVYPQEVESLLIGHDKVADVAVFGVPNPEFGEVVKAVVQPIDWADAGPELERELIAWCRERLSGVKCPKSIDFERQLPRLDNGKLYKKQLRERYLSTR